MDIRVSAPGRQAKPDCSVIAVWEDKKPGAPLAKALAARSYKGKAGEDVLLPAASGPTGRRPGGAAPGLVLAVGMGKSSKAGYEQLRRAACRIWNRARLEKWVSVRIDFESFALKGKDAAYSASALAEGLELSSYRFDRYKSEKKDPVKASRLKTAELSAAAPRRRAVTSALAETKIVCEGVFMARDLGNEPANVLYPESYAARIRKAAVAARVRCTVFDEKRLKTLGMGGILGVGQGSSRKPRLVILEYKPARAKNKKPIVLVGKGITFDTGGISIKPSKDMGDMKFDMCGSAAVAAALVTASRLKLPLHVVGLAPLAENMPGGNAQRPGDVIRCYNGKTVDVLNTDAEGRLVLADALAYAKKFDPQCVVDVATLTGLCHHFFDWVASGVMGTDAALVNRLRDAGEKSGERLWELPLWEDYEDMVKGTTGDVQNISRSMAGTITAGIFLKHFGGHSPWAHLDIAGTAWGGGKPYRPAGATGVGVRLFIEFLKSYV